jgi:hypothetical protein
MYNDINTDFSFGDMEDKDDSFFDISDLINEVEEEDLRIEELQKEVFKKCGRPKAFKELSLPQVQAEDAVFLRIFSPLQ